MPLYGSIAAAKRLIAASGNSTFSADEEARLTDLQKAVSALIEQETGRAFGTSATPETVAVEAAGLSPALVLPKGVRTVASVTVGATWDGTEWTGGTALDPDDYRPVWQEASGEFLGLRLLTGGVWFGMVVVAGTWEDTDADGAVPDDVTYAANLLMAEFFKREKASPAGVLGADGVSVIPLRNPLKEPMVAATIERWRVVGRLVV